MTSKGDDLHTLFMQEYACTVIPAREGWSLGLLTEDPEPEWTEIIAWKVFIKSRAAFHRAGYGKRLGKLQQRKSIAAP